MNKEFKYYENNQSSRTEQGYPIWTQPFKYYENNQSSRTLGLNLLSIFLVQILRK